MRLWLSRRPMTDTGKCASSTCRSASSTRKHASCGAALAQRRSGPNHEQLSPIHPVCSVTYPSAGQSAMIPVTSFAGKTVAVFGLGGSGLASCHALKAGGAEVIAGDDGADRLAEAARAGFITADLRTVSWANFAALVLTPGAPLTHPSPHWTVLAARQAGVEVIGDIELFCRERARIAPDAPFVAITGTNGKSTTTALIAHILRSVGRDVQMGGNIGTPILALEPPAADRVHVVECSSFQIDLAPSLDPTVGILLNVTPDHLDRHGTMADYAAIKERLVAKADTAVIAVDDEYTCAVAVRRE